MRFSAPLVLLAGVLAAPLALAQTAPAPAPAPAPPPPGPAQAPASPPNARDVGTCIGACIAACSASNSPTTCASACNVACSGQPPAAPPATTAAPPPPAPGTTPAPPATAPTVPAPPSTAPVPPPPPSGTTAAPPAPAPSATTVIAPPWAPRNETRPRGAQAPASSWDRVGLRGFEVSVLGGIMAPDSGSPVTSPNFYAPNGSAQIIGDVLSGAYQPYGFDPFGLAVDAGYRFFPWLSAGIDFQFASFAALGGTDSGDYTDGTSQLQRRMFTLGVYAKYYFTQFHSHLHPWIQLGLGYSGDSASYTRGGAQGNSANPVTQAYYLSENGVDVRAKIGLDWRLAPVFSVGPWASYERVIPVQSCAEIDADPSGPAFEQSLTGQNVCKNPPVQGSGYGLAAAGIFAKVTFDPFGH